MKVKMIARKAFPYAGRHLKEGASFDALSEKDALILEGSRQARRSEVLQAKNELAEEDHDAEPRQKRRYRRRDMSAES